MIRFNIPAITGHEQAYLADAIASGRLSGDGPFTRRCQDLLEQTLRAPKVLLTPSCTAALEIAALLLNLGPGDEVIMPSYTFVSSANAFVLRGATAVFVDVDPRTMNLDPVCVRAAVTPRTRAIVAVHYAGIGCDMDSLIAIARECGAMVIEDAAQGIQATYRGRPLAAIADIGCLSFHDTKNLHCGEGGALVINNPDLIHRAEIIREKGTNRANFMRGEVDKYTWVDIGSSYLPSELNAAFLLAQLEGAEAITKRRLAIWNRYAAALRNSGFELPDPPAECAHNAHLFWIKARDEQARNALIENLRGGGIQAPFHYVPLHSTGPGRAAGRFHGEDHVTTRDAGRLLRLPLHASLTDADQETVIAALLRLAR